MTDPPVRARPDNLVVMLECHRRAPVTAECDPGPHRKEEPGGDERHTNHVDSFCRAGPPLPGPARHDRRGEENTRDPDRSEVRRARGKGFLACHALDTARGNPPVQAPGNPQRGNQLGSHVGHRPLGICLVTLDRPFACCGNASAGWSQLGASTIQMWSSGTTAFTESRLPMVKSTSPARRSLRYVSG